MVPIAQRIASNQTLIAGRLKAVPQELEGHYKGSLGLRVCTRLLYRPKGTAIPMQASNEAKLPTRGSELPLSRGNKHAITPVPKEQAAKGFQLQLFTVPKKDGGKRPTYHQSKRIELLRG